MSSDTTQPRWGSFSQAAREWGVSRTTVTRWAAAGRIRACRVGDSRIQVDLNDIDRMREPLPADRRLTAEDRRLAAEVAAALLPLADWQKEKLALLLSLGPPVRQQAGGEHDAA